MNETIQTREVLISPPFDHINQNDPQLLEDPYFGDALRLPGGGICWAASLAMGIAAHTGQPSRTLLSEIGRFTYELFPQHFAEIQDDIRQKYGRDAALPFIQESRHFMVNRSGGLDTFFLMRYPNQTEILLKHILNDRLGLGIKVHIPLRLTGLHNEPEDLIEELQHIKSTRTCVLGVGIETFSAYNQGYFHHMVYVSGAEKADGTLQAIRISDPNLNGPFWLSGKGLGNFTVGHGAKQTTADETIYTVRINPTPLIWLGTE